MSRYIEEADFLIHLVKKSRYSSKTIGEAINESHSIDIVRCRECRWYNEREGCLFSTAEITADDYCSYGEREGE